MKLTFKQHSLNPYSSKVFIDDKEITSIVNDIKICAYAGDVTTVYLKLFPSELDIDLLDVKLTHNDFTIEDMINALSKQSAIYTINKSDKVNITEKKEMLDEIRKAEKVTIEWMEGKEND